MQAITETPVEFHAAMFRALGNQTRLSRSGHSIVFARDTLGRRDLSGESTMAAAQLREAGIDVGSITPDDVEAYTTWHDRIYNSRRIGEARILVTRPFTAEIAGDPVPVNRVALIDGWGNEVEHLVARCAEEYDPHARNRLGRSGAYCNRPDYAEIERAISAIRSRHREFAAAPVVDNNAVRVRHA